MSIMLRGVDQLFLDEVKTSLTKVLLELKVIEDAQEILIRDPIIWADECPHCYTKVEPKATGCSKCHSSFVD